MKIVIVGAGIAGLAASHEFTKLGHEVEIYEASDRAGGRGRLLNRPGSADWADVGTQYFHSNYKIGLRLIDELGLTPKLKKISGKTRMFTGKGPGQSYLLNQALPWLKPGGVRGNLKVLGYAAKLILSKRSDTFAALAEQESLDRVAALESTNDTFTQDHIVRMMSLIGGLSEPSETNVNALQIWRLLKIIMLTDYVSLKGGTATLHAELAARANIHFNRPVKALLESHGKVTGIELETGDHIAADHVVIAAHAPMAAKLVPTEWSRAKDLLTSIEMPPAILVSLFLDKPLEQDVWTYFMPFDHEGPVTFCVDTQQKSPGNTPSGKATVQAWIINPAAAGLMDKSDEDIAAIARKDIAPYLPAIDNSIEGVAVTRHAHAVPQSSVGHNARVLEFLAEIDGRDGISFCGDYLSGGYMESALWSVERAVSRFGQTEKLAKAV